MDQDTARTLFKEGAVLFLLDFPVGSEVGIDMQSWNTGEKFKGIKMIPPGMHFVYFSVANKEGEIAPRTGMFINLSKKEVVAMKWNASAEDFEEVTSTEELDRLKSNLQSLDPFLGPYPHDTYRKWISLSHRVSAEVVEQLEPLSKRITSVADLVPSKTFQQKHRHRDSKKEEPVPMLEVREASDQASTSQTENLSKISSIGEDFMLPEMHHRPGTNLRFTEFPTKRYPEGSTPKEITLHSLDSSYVLEQLLKRWDDPVQLLGELQLAFLAFLLGQSYLGFEHWKQLVIAIATSDKALTERPGFFTEFLNDLYFQLSEVSEDFFVDIVSQNNFLVHTLHTLFVNIRECSGAGGKDVRILKEKAEKLMEHLQTRLKWDFGAEPDDEAPVVVEDY